MKPPLAAATSRSRILSAIVAGLSLAACSGFAQAQQSDFNGVWSDGIAPIEIHQSGESVEFRYITNEFDHHFVGHLVAPGEIEGEYAPRRNRNTGCETTLAVRIHRVAGEAFKLDWRALDSNCDLAAGQTGEDALYYRQN